MNIHLQSLLNDMSDNSYRPGESSEKGMYESSKTISWTAHEKARELTDVNYLPDLYNLIKTSKSQDEKRNAYFIIGCIAKNANEEHAIRFLLDSLKVEKQTTLIRLILHRLAEIYKPAHLDLSIIYQMIEKKGTLIPYSAYMPLTNTGQNVERPLLDLLEKRTERDDLIWIIRALSYVGTEESVLVLKTYLKHKKLQVRNEVRNHLPTIMIRAGLPITEICRLCKVSTQFVEERRVQFNILTRPGRTV